MHPQLLSLGMSYSRLLLSADPLRPARPRQAQPSPTQPSWALLQKRVNEMLRILEYDSPKILS